MLTKWAKNALPTNNNDSFIPAPGTASGYNLGYIEVKTTANNTAYISVNGAYFKGNNYVSSQISESGNASGIMIGSDSTPPTENDYHLGSQIYGSTYPGSVVHAIVYDSNKDSLSYVSALTVTNNSESEITIREIGRVATFDTSNTRGGSTSSGRKTVMTDRTLLETPLVIAPGESGTVQYIFEYYNNSVNVTAKVKKS